MPGIGMSCKIMKMTLNTTPVTAITLRNAVPSPNFFVVTKVDAADQGLGGAEFYMVNREETEKIIKYAFLTTSSFSFI